MARVDKHRPWSDAKKKPFPTAKYSPPTSKKHAEDQFGLREQPFSDIFGGKDVSARDVAKVSGDSAQGKTKRLSYDQSTHRQGR